jgi:penicillin-binding protein 1A
MILRIIAYLFGVGSLLFLAIAASVAWYVADLTKDLPNYDVLAQYAPPVTTRVHAADGELVAEYAHERRLYLPIQAVPDLLKQAFISAEDKNFYQHSGLDYFGIMRALSQDVARIGSGGTLVGASTITQQVARNFLLTLDQTWQRKITEGILAVRIEQAYSKDKILELYLNEIPLGLGSYGIASASLTYFSKAVHELTLPEVAYLAALPKGPSNYDPYRYPDRAMERRNWVIDRMVENGYVSAADGEAAKLAPLGIKTRNTGPTVFAADYYAEEVRRELSAMYGETKLYEGGLSVRTSLDPGLQVIARQALMDGLVSFDQNLGWRGPVQHFDDLGPDWGVKVADVPAYRDLIEWRVAVVLSVTPQAATIGLQPARLSGSNAIDARRETGTITLADMKWAKWASGANKGKAIKGPNDVLKAGDVIYVEPANGAPNRFQLRQVPEIQGGMVVMDPHTGRVLAMVGGFSFSLSQFNRATQAYRQPGSSFKPIVYSAALDNGYTPSSVIMDAPIEIDQGPGLPPWAPENYSNEYFGPSTLRTGIEQSRNVMTVRLAQDMGMPLVAEYARRFGVVDNLPPVLSMALGAGESTVLRMTAGYAVFANGGKEVHPTLIDRIQDRYGKTIFRREDRLCVGCDADAWHGQDEPTIIDDSSQVLDPMTAYQITSMLEGVIQRGTGTAAKVINKPVAGKTGTTNDNRDAWFIGFTPDLVVGTYLGYDTPRSLGATATGGGLATPIFTEFMQMALADKPAVPFRVPKGITFVPIDQHTGLRAQQGGPGTIMEAFKPGTAPPDAYSIIGFTDSFGKPLTVLPDRDRAVVSGTGGLY